MTKRLVTIVPTETANIASIMSALRRIGGEPRLASNPTELACAKAIVLPGVGSFGAARAALDTVGMTEPLQTSIMRGVPTLAVCLGMQLLFEGSEESPDVAGLSILPGRIERFPMGVRSPHVGWNTVIPVGSPKIITNGDAYFTHSYRLEALPNGANGGITEYRTTFISAIEFGNVLACQFHPELSGAWGLSLLERWLFQKEVPC